MPHMASLRCPVLSFCHGLEECKLVSSSSKLGLSNDGQLPVRNSADPVNLLWHIGVRKQPRCCRSMASITRTSAPNQQKPTVAETNEFSDEVGVDIASTRAQFCERRRGAKSDVARRHFDQPLDAASTLNLSPSACLQKAYAQISARPHSLCIAGWQKTEDGGRIATHND